MVDELSTTDDCDLLLHELAHRGRRAARLVEERVAARRLQLAELSEGPMTAENGKNHPSDLSSAGEQSVEGELALAAKDARERTPESIDYTTNSVRSTLRLVEPDPMQLEVACAPISAFQVVDAPPGTGKTFTACRRIAWLIEQGVPAHRIWLISFTRSAIAELRIRIRQLSTTGHAVEGLVASTLDSRAWHLLDGFTTRAGNVLASDHEASIEEAVHMLENPSTELADWMSTIQHLVVDEAQDLVGVRARLLHAIVANLPPECGVTIFGDRAQAIYGFAEREEGEVRDPFMEQCRVRWNGKVKGRSLTRVFRTENDGLTRLFNDTRTELLERLEQNEKQAYDWLRELLIAGFPALDFEDPDQYDLQLHRRRIAALLEASYALASGEPARLRLSGFPRAIHPWVALVLQKNSKDRLYRADFDDLFHSAHKVYPSTIWPTSDDAWDVLRKVGSTAGGAVSVSDLRIRLASGNVPDQLLLPEFGYSGPIYSTIHASKGREAGQVDVELPPYHDSERNDWGEEAKVLFVAATRASNTLVVKEASPLYVTSATDGRNVRRLGRQRKIQVEVGLEGDIDLPSLLLGPAEEVLESQAVLGKSHASAAKLIARRAEAGGDNCEYRLFEDERRSEPFNSRHLGRMPKSFYWMLKNTGSKFWPDKYNYPPSYIQHLYSIGARTVAFAPDDPAYTDAVEPFGTSGFFLAPMLVGLPTVPFFN